MVVGGGGRGVVTGLVVGGGAVVVGGGGRGVVTGLVVGGLAVVVGGGGRGVVTGLVVGGGAVVVGGGGRGVVTGLVVGGAVAGGSHWQILVKEASQLSPVQVEQQGMTLVSDGPNFPEVTGKAPVVYNL